MTNDTEIIIEREVQCVMRDGVKLNATVYRPAAYGNFPVLLTRLPYNKNLPDFSHRYIDPIRIALNGFVVIIQDVRGRFASEGEFEPFIQELEDGYDTVNWAAELPYSNGKVGMFGLSYYGMTQLYAALERPSALRAIFPAMTGNVTGSGLFARDGVTELASAQTWMLDSVSSDYIKRLDSSQTEIVSEIVSDLNTIDDHHRYVPFSEWPPVYKHPQLIPFFERFFIEDFSAELKEEVEKRIEKYGPLNLPAYHLAGWYDSHLAPTLLNYEQMTTAKNNQKLIIGPWSHGYFDSDIGERSFGVYASGHAIDGTDDITSLHIKWFTHWLKENNTHISVGEDPIKLFVMGINEWRTEKEWPLKRTEYTPLYLTSNCGANLTLDSGKLQWQIPGKTGKDEYIHDPANPVPSHGGGTLFYKGRNSGPRDQREIENREDVVVYTSAPLEEALEVTGWVKLYLWASTNAVDTDFTAKLIDVMPDGRAYNLTDGIVRAKYAQNKKGERNIQDEVVQYEIDMWATSNVFLPGHSIRLEIASSNFPRFDVNPSTGNTTKDTVEMIKANQVIYHGKEYPTHLLLPIIP